MLGAQLEGKKIIFFPHRLEANKGEGYLDYLEKTLGSEGIDAAIIVPGGEKKYSLPWIPSEKMNIVYSAADVTIVPSSSPESFGQTPLESITCGTPVVGFRFGNLASLIDTFPAFYESRPEKDDLVNRTISILNANVESSIRASQETIQREYNTQAMVNQYLELYSKIRMAPHVNIPIIGNPGEIRYFLSPTVAKYDASVYFPSTHGSMPYILGELENNIVSSCVENASAQDIFSQVRCRIDDGIRALSNLIAVGIVVET